MIPVPITPTFAPRGAGGAPAGLGALNEVTSTMVAYSHAIVATGGFESCTIELATDLDAAFGWLASLGATIVVYGPDAQVIWEGFLSGVSVAVGAETIDLSLAEMANAVKVRYQPALGGGAATAFVTDANSIALYGRKELVHSAATLSSAAASTMASRILAARRQPTARRSGGTQSGGETGGVRVTLSGTGWYYALDWLTTSSTSTTSTQTTTQLTTLLTAYNAVNAFFATPLAADIIASGQNDTEYIEPDTTYREKIERLLAVGNSSGQRLAWGVYEGRRWRVKPWAGATPTTIGYRRSLGDQEVLTAGGGPVAPWDVRPDAMYQVVDLADPSAPAGADSLSAFYVERVTCTVDQSGPSVRLEPATSGDLDVLLARVR